jgi:hypothetical protein
MSQLLRETINVPNEGVGTGNLLSLHVPSMGDDQYPPQSAQNQAPNGASNFADGSGPIFSMYLEMATEEDKKMVENWKADADGILIFVRPQSSSLVIHPDLIGHRLVCSPLLLRR